jgi:hypothetical protein
MKKLFILLMVTSFALSTALGQKTHSIQLVTKPNDRKIDVLIDGKLFTSYIYPVMLKKPVLWPVISAGGNELTRCFPMKNKAGERADHPHHVGIWLNYGDVNGLDFWNNSEAIPAKDAAKYGTIYHETVEQVKSGKNIATLITTASWKDSSGKKLLDDVTENTFRCDGDIRIIDRMTVLTAANGKVDFTDNKEGVFAIRVARELELPGKGKMELTDSHGKVTVVEASSDPSVSGNYLSSEGIEGSKVWGTRGKWMKLYGIVKGEKVAVVIFDHPQNPGYPTYWHARDYGLFAANTLGQKILSAGKEVLNFKLENGESVTFRYRLAIFPGNPDADIINKMAAEYQGMK